MGHKKGCQFGWEIPILHRFRRCFLREKKADFRCQKVGLNGRRMGIPHQKIEQKGCFWWEIRNLFYLGRKIGQKSWAARCQEGGKMGAKLIIGGDWSIK